MKEKLNRPDFSMYLVHFTKDGAFCNEEQNELIKPYSKMTAKERLLSILQTKKIVSSKMPWTNSPCVCFTECPWSSLLAHTQQYSSFGVGFTKKFIFNHNGAPALYMRVNIFEKFRKKTNKNSIEKEMWTFVTPFSPEYGNSYTKRLLKRWVDFSQEREWRTPIDLSFEYSDITFIIVKSLEDYESFPKSLRVELAANNVRIIIMDNYKLIEELWPVHIPVQNK